MKRDFKKEEKKVVPCAECIAALFVTSEDFPECCFGKSAIEPLWEKQDDFFFWRSLVVKVGQEVKKRTIN